MSLGNAAAARQAQIIGEAVDYLGERWEVRELRETSHGWPLALGWPAGAPRGKGASGGVRTIISPELADYLQRTRLRDIDLPIALSVVKRLRAALNISWSWDDWWRKREDDLRTLTLEQFAIRHGCSTGAASQRRTALPPSPPD